jgi:hypothetical protein
VGGTLDMSHVLGIVPFSYGIIFSRLLVHLVGGVEDDGYGHRSFEVVDLGYVSVL